MTDLTRYRDFAPTGSDPLGLGLDDQQDWLVAPCGQNRDSGELDLSNFATLEKWLTEEVGPEDFDNGWQIHRFGHWACGWFEIIIAAPGSRAAEILDEVDSALADYPVLDDEDYSAREFDAACEAWKWTNLSERVDILRGHDLSIFAARRDEIPQGLPYYDDFYQPS